MNINFSKLSLIIKREYLTRVKGKGFIISTILAPIFIIGIFLVPMLLGSFGSSTSISVFAIVDETNSIADRMIEANPTRYTIKDGVTIDSLRAETLRGTISGYIIISNAVLDGNNAELFNAGSGGLSLNNEIRENLRSAVREELFTRTQVNDEVRAIFELRPGIDSRRVSAGGDQEENAANSFLIAYLMGFAIYMAMFSYGALIMQSVMEEKSNRVMEIIVSSAKPMELLIGKVIGVVSLGITQIVIWFIAFTGISAVMLPLAILMGAEVPTAVDGAAAAQAEAFAMPEIAISIWIFFGIFYILGFLIYGGLFAAVGAAADTPQDTSQLALPIYLPIIIPMLLMMPVTTDPNSTLAVVSSLIPFFAPILMMARIVVTDVPLWQSLGSVVLMIITFIGLMWMSGKIYRIGILMYGKKVTLSEVYRWLRY